MKTRFLICAFLCLVLIAKSQNNLIPKLKLAPFAQGFQYPIDLANCGDNRLFVVERLGKIWAIGPDGKKITNYPFLDITDKVFTVFPNDYDERGLLGLAFHPNYPDSPYLYVNYIGLDSNLHISRFMVNPNNPNRAIKGSERLLLRVPQPKGVNYINHKAGCLKFGPDGYLYGTLGDGGYADDPMNNAQDMSKLLGKMFRIDVNKWENGKRYAIPPTNPFVNKPGIKPEIWASGLRNPFRFSFDKLTGDLWLPDVGQELWEEINMEKKGDAGGRNYGWSCYEGYHNFKFDSCDYNGMPYTFPIVEYKHSQNNCAAITGGFVYRGSKYPKLYGKYIYNDYCTGRYSLVFRFNQTWLNVFVLDDEDGEYQSFGEDSKGELYAVDGVSGEIERVIDASQTSTAQDVIANLDIKLSPNPNKGQFTVEFTVPQGDSYSITITNITGATILSEKKYAVAGKNVWNFTSSKFGNGNYLLHIQSSKLNLTKNFIVEK